MTDRRDIASLFGIAVTIREPGNTGHGIEHGAYMLDHLLILRRDNGQIIATVSRDDLFDRNGNRFHTP